jgi:hypothetical protein
MVFQHAKSDDAPFDFAGDALKFSEATTGR